MILQNKFKEIDNYMDTIIKAVKERRNPPEYTQATQTGQPQAQTRQPQAIPVQTGQPQPQAAQAGQAQAAQTRQAQAAQTRQSQPGQPQARAQSVQYVQYAQAQYAQAGQPPKFELKVVNENTQFEPSRVKLTNEQLIILEQRQQDPPAPVLKPQQQPQREKRDLTYQDNIDCKKYIDYKIPDTICNFTTNEYNKERFKVHPDKVEIKTCEALATETFKILENERNKCSNQ